MAEEASNVVRQVARAAFQSGSFCYAKSIVTADDRAAPFCYATKKNGSGFSRARMSRGKETDLAKKVRGQVAIGSAKMAPQIEWRLKDGNSFEGSS